MADNNISKDKFGLALSYLLLGEFSGLALDISAKYILQQYSLVQFIFVRSLIATLIFLLICPWYGGLSSIKTKKWKWHLLRAFLSIVAMFGFFSVSVSSGIKNGDPQFCYECVVQKLES